MSEKRALPTILIALTALLILSACNAGPDNQIDIFITDTWANACAALVLPALLVLYAAMR